MTLQSFVQLLGYEDNLAFFLGGPLAPDVAVLVDGPQLADGRSVSSRKEFPLEEL